MGLTNNTIIKGLTKQMFSSGVGALINKQLSFELIQVCTIIRFTKFGALSALAAFFFSLSPSIASNTN